MSVHSAAQGCVRSHGNRCRYIAYSLLPLSAYSLVLSSGKSLTFQLPVIALNELNFNVCTIVVSPLISLIEDQVSSLRALGINAGAIGNAVIH